ncbi:hypothetical protein pdam_00004022, partial [Pocillopora damicornis]
MKNAKKPYSCLNLDTTATSSVEPLCLASAESTRSGLATILDKVKRVYFQQLHPETIHEMSPKSPENIRKYFQPYDPSPNAIKGRTDEAMKLYRELKALKINKKLLKLRERKAVHMASAILLNNYGWNPYNQDYYAGEWLSGPNLLCWEPVCSVFPNLNGVLPHFKPKNVADLETLKGLIEKYSLIFDRYVENWKLGVRTGYVRTYKACKVGVHVLKNQKYKGMETEQGIYDQEFAKTLLKPEFFESLTKAMKDTWTAKYQNTVEEYFKQSILQNIGIPVTRMISYLENEYLCNCPNQEEVLSGLGKLPLRYFIKKETLQKLPNGQRLSGARTYQRLMRFFTTMDVSPAQLRTKAVGRLSELYRKVVILAKLYTKEQNKNTAINKLKKVLRNRDQWFNNQPFPSSESGEDAFVMCHDTASAQVMKTKVKPVIDTLFYSSGRKKTVPACSLEVTADFHPFVSYHAYGVGSKDCTSKSTQYLPFFMDKFGPKWTEYTTTAHEQLPGHQLEVQSYVEYFEDSCEDAIHWLGAFNYFPGFTEGWTTYIEYELLPQDSNLYSDTSDKEVLLQKYGMIYYQILAALRIIVDIDLNYYDKTTSDALYLYKLYAWEDNTDLAQKDILRSQALPGFVASYVFGQMEISRVRGMAERGLGRDFNLKDFHYEVLRLGEYPLGYLEEHIRAYIACKKNPDRDECKDCLYKTSSDASLCQSSSEATRSQLTELLAEIQQTFFYQLHPEHIARMAEVTPELIREHFQPFDPSPDAIKRRTDKALELRRRLNTLQIDTKKLKLRERKAIHVASDVLLAQGWDPYGMNYYSGDWLLGPNLFCWQPVCQVFGNLNSVFSHFKPDNMDKLERLKTLFEQYHQVFERYVENWKLGARSGYLRPFKACKAAVFAVKYKKYREMAINGESGIYKQPFANILLNSGFFASLSKSVNDTWEEKHQENVKEFFKQSLENNIAKPVVRMLRTFPTSESDEDAFIKCSDSESAEEFCPKRWEAMQKWMENTKDTMTNHITPVLAANFHSSGPKKTIPVCGVDLYASFQPYASYHSYGIGAKDCSYKGSQALPFFMDRFGPKWTEYTTTAHEQMPGHHLEVQSYTEYFQDSCKDPIHWLGAYNYFPGFTEGWTTYTEYQLLPQDTNLYSDTSNKEVLLQKYGMIYYQLLAALRAVVDIDLNYYQKSAFDALRMYKQYVWEDNTDQAKKDIIRSEGLPGQVASYVSGQLEISRLRSLAERELGQDFDLKDFHYEVLRQGEIPLRYLDEHIKAYIACKKNPSLEECGEF